MDLPSPAAGIVQTVHVKVGDKVSGIRGAGGRRSRRVGRFVLAERLQRLAFERAEFFAAADAARSDDPSEIPARRYEGIHELLGAKVLAHLLARGVRPALERFVADGGMVIGICNGFQVLCEAGLLPGALIRNRSLQFRCEHVYLRVATHDSP
ncbi:MAG: hypothetical protein HGB14_05355, partial [Anaerolineaceae bacterium]|nr:hypothetical protein [Anaerolineaceae bacterium]